MRRRILAAVGLAAVLAFLVAGVASASIPAPDGTINGCRKNTDGSLRVIDSTASCPNGWTALDWNQTGPPGVSGYEIAWQRSVNIDPGNSGDVVAQCPSGKKALGGGYGGAGGSNMPLFHIAYNAPTEGGGGWQVGAINIDTAVRQYDAFAVCAAVS